jgi:hypothetical protein
MSDGREDGRGDERERMKREDERERMKREDGREDGRET